MKDGKIIRNIELILQNSMNGAVIAENDHGKVFAFIISQDSIQLFSIRIKLFPKFLKFRFNRYFSVASMNSLADV